MSRPRSITPFLFAVAACLVPITGSAKESQAGSTVSAPGTTDQWRGHTRHRFEVSGHQAWVVEPSNPLPGKPWTWCTEFPDAFTDRTGVPQLLEKGIHHAHISDFNRLGCEEQLRLMDEFHKVMVSKGFAAKVGLIGISRGGFMAYRWAQRNPDKVVFIYGDAPVCDLKSWPGGFGKGKGSPKDWQHAKNLYGWKSDEEARAFRGNALDEEPLSRLAAAKIPLLHVVGDADDVVPVAENTAILAERYRKLGGDIAVLHHAAGHHPHGLDDPAPVVRFMLGHLAPANPVR
ncbi:prolyl oligopeptidase family serine peptidase [Luteolibacter sp. SL250]|uniref:alpha/beta hydrolase family protein n=1 Tax=Luteolibacter sp. SL250 TaxID=2995170 RepID=UPI00226FF1C9|nr:prolyl oligopeptidase family serine peptidase [Luteolibacter sp. SL250]WAC20630.1 prolyl oligopeptidase family serine peptidase [Luteolibacter sp. SL250]